MPLAVFKMVDNRSFGTDFGESTVLRSLQKTNDDAWKPWKMYSHNIRCPNLHAGKNVTGKTKL